MTQWGLFIFTMMAPFTIVSCTVLVPGFNRSFYSLPALFGKRLPLDNAAGAYLQRIDDWPLLCADDDKVINPNDIVTPDDGLPVALLVQRGECTFWEKAAVASSWNPPVEYVIIYDDDSSPDLVPMSSDLETNMTLLFVTRATGLELISLMAEHKNTTGSLNGLLLQLDAEIPMSAALTTGVDITAYLIAAMTGFLAFLIFFGCILLCVQMGCIHAQRDERGRIILFAGAGDAGGAHNSANRLVTENQVKEMEEEEFQTEESGSADEEEGNKCSCAICLDVFEDKELVRVLPCGHRYHDDCLIPWLTTRQSCCPLCKLDVLEHINCNSACKETPSGEESPASGQRRMSSFWEPIRHLRGWLPLRMQSGSESDGSRGEHEDEESPRLAAETELVPTTIRNEANHAHREEPSR